MCRVYSAGRIANSGHQSTFSRGSQCRCLHSAVVFKHLRPLRERHGSTVLRSRLHLPPRMPQGSLDVAGECQRLRDGCDWLAYVMAVHVFMLSHSMGAFVSSASGENAGS